MQGAGCRVWGVGCRRQRAPLLHPGLFDLLPHLRQTARPLSRNHCFCFTHVGGWGSHLLALSLSLKALDGNVRLFFIRVQPLYSIVQGFRGELVFDSCITQLKAQGPSRTCDESNEAEEDEKTPSRRLLLSSLELSDTQSMSLNYEP